jgi:hypothetical protein
MCGELYATGRGAARALLEAALADRVELKGKAGQFIGGVAFGREDALTPKKTAWLSKLIEKAGLPPLAEGGEA